MPPEPSKKNMKWKDMEGLNLKYVDDNLSVEKICMENAPFDPPASKTKLKHAITCQNKFRWIKRRAEERGMKVNTDKTAMVCISDAMSYNAEAFILDAEGKIRYKNKRGADLDEALTTLLGEMGHEVDLSNHEDDNEA